MYPFASQLLALAASQRPACSGSKLQNEGKQACTGLRNAAPAALPAAQRNAIGAHSGSYCVYKALAVACGKLDPNYLPKLHMTRPVFDLGPFKTWADKFKIATMDPWGHLVTDVSTVL